MDENPKEDRKYAPASLLRSPASWFMSDSRGMMAEASSEGSLVHSLKWVAILVAMLAAVLGAGHLAAWFGGYMSDRGQSAITMKTNTALCLTLVGVALMLLVPQEIGSARRWMARVCAALALLIGLAVLTENLSGRDLGIDQLLVVETPGAMGVSGPNRMGTPASLSVALIGLALVILSRPDHRGVRGVQTLALAVCLIALLGISGFLYGAERFYGVAQYTGIAWLTAVALLLMGLGLLCARPAEGLMAQVTANDPGGVSLRRLLPVVIILPLFLGWLRLAGERIGVFDAATGTAIMMLLFIVAFSAAIFHVGRATSRSAQALWESQERLALAQRAGGVGVYDWNVVTGEVVWTPELERIYGMPAPADPRQRQAAWVAGLHPKERARILEKMRQWLESTRDEEGWEYRFLRPDGQERWIAG